MTDTKLVTEKIPRHKIIRELLRHYLEFRELVLGYGAQEEGADGRKHVLEHSYWIYNEDGTKKEKDTVSLSFWDLQEGINEISPRKREALFLHVIMDMKQKDAADIMGITPIVCGQYSIAAAQQLAKKYFPAEEFSNE